MAKGGLGWWGAGGGGGGGAMSLAFVLDLNIFLQMYQFKHQCCKQ